MHVVHVIKATGIAGAERHLLTLLPALRARQMDARLLLLVEPDKPLDDYVRVLETCGVPVQREIIAHDLDIRLYARLRRIFRDLKAEIVHTHLWHADLFGILAARLAGVKTVISSRHNDDAFRHKSAIRLVNRLLWRMVSTGIAISEAIARFSIEVENAPPAKIHVVRYGLKHNPHAVNPSTARKALRGELGLDDDALLVGMVCRLTAQKGVTYGLQAFAQTALQFPTAHLVIAGDGPLREELEEEARALKVEEKVHFLGWREDSAEVLAALDVFLVPSLWEGFGLVILEAMAQQIPVIGSRVSAIPEVVADKETGLLVPPRDVDGLANAMNTLLADKSLRRYMGLLGEDRLETHFSAERMAEDTAAIYRKLANKP